MHLPIQVWLIGGAIVVLLLAIYILVATIKQRLLTYHLTLLANDIRAVGLATLKKEPIRCTYCNNRSHVHIWQYGEKHPVEVLLCYLCASRIAKLLEAPSLPQSLGRR